MEAHKLSLKSKHLVIHDINSDIELTLPDLTDCHLSVELTPNNNNEIPLETSLITSIPFIYPQSALGIFKASLVKKSVMTTSNAEKDCLNLKFKLAQSFGVDDASATKTPEFEYEPGYSIDIVTPNAESEVSQLLARLKITSPNHLIRIRNTNETKKLGINYVKLTENANCVSIGFFFKYCVDIRVNCLKKAMLRMLASHCADKADEIKLLELCSKEGADHYLSIVRENSLTLLDLLNTFESCEPPLEHLIQMLPPLTTRSYTLCSYFDKAVEKMDQHESDLGNEKTF